MAPSASLTPCPWRETLVATAGAAVPCAAPRVSRHRSRTSRERAGSRPKHSVLAVPRSRRGGGEDLLVLGVVVSVVMACGDDEQVVVHLVAREDLAELGDEQPRLQMPRQLL